MCEACYFWLHIKCEGISPAEYASLCSDDKPWTCRDSTNFHFTDSFFEHDTEADTLSMDGNIPTQTTDVDICDQLEAAGKDTPKDFFVLKH